MHDTNTWRDRHPEKVKERKSQKPNGQKPKHKWPNFSQKPPKWA